jgi:hypothetical protein
MMIVYDPIFTSLLLLTSGSQRHTKRTPVHGGGRGGGALKKTFNFRPTQFQFYAFTTKLYHISAAQYIYIYRERE